MPAQSRHRILRQVLDLDVTTASGAHEVQETLAVPFRAGNLPGLETLFDRVASPDDHLRVERLEIDLGTISGGDWYEQFFERLRLELNRAFDPAAAPDRFHVEPIVSSRHSGPDHTFERLLFFLEHGRLPWWSGKPSGPDWIASLSERLTPPQWQSLRGVLQRSVQARRRFIGAVDGRVLIQAVMAWGGPPESLRGLDILLAIDDRIATGASLPDRYWRRLLSQVIAGDFDGPQFLREMLSSLIPDEPDPGGPHAEGAFGEKAKRCVELLHEIEPSIPAPWQTWFEEVAGDGRQSVASAPAAAAPGETGAGEAPVSQDAPSQLAVPGDEGRRQSHSDSTTRQAPDSPAKREPGRGSPPDGVVSMEDWLADKRARGTDRGLKQAPDAGERAVAEVFVEGAGVVIVHPFLKELFDSRGLIRDGDFIDEDSRQSGVGLLAYLTFGPDLRPEYDLLLPKLLCNMPWESHLPESMLGDKDKAACDKLLEAVLRHWSVLKGCSVEWMREQFFLRDGKLEQVDHGWKLTVERHAQDVLLDKLPWGLGMISLPWQPTHLFLNWLE